VNFQIFTFSLSLIKIRRKKFAHIILPASEPRGDNLRKANVMDILQMKGKSCILHPVSH
jgi:hypothetical protein